MIDDVKGYVVRGTWDTGPVVCHVPGGFWHDRSPHVFREIEYARSQRGLMLQQGCTDVSIFLLDAIPYVVVLAVLALMSRRRTHAAPESLASVFDAAA